jgi:predicted TPR repeat methyltransferase
MRLTDWDHNAWYHRLLLRQVPAGAQHVLDVGCGAGTLGRRLAAAHHGLGLAFAVLRPLTGAELLRHESTHDEMPIADSQLTTREVRAAAGDLLPGVRVRRLLLWRYLFTWRKPR